MKPRCNYLVVQLSQFRVGCQADGVRATGCGRSAPSATIIPRVARAVTWPWLYWSFATVTQAFAGDHLPMGGGGRAFDLQAQDFAVDDYLRTLTSGGGEDVPHQHRDLDLPRRIARRPEGDLRCRFGDPDFVGGGQRAEPSPGKEDVRADLALRRRRNHALTLRAAEFQSHQLALEGRVDRLALAAGASGYTADHLGAASPRRWAHGSRAR